jgi:hypothetical protein
MAADLSAARGVLEETKRTSWQYIWNEEMKSWFTRLSKPHARTKIIENPVPAPAIAAQEQIECAEKAPRSSVVFASIWIDGVQLNKLYDVIFVHRRCGAERYWPMLIAGPAGEP